MKKKKNKTIKLAKNKVTKLVAVLLSGAKKIRRKKVKLGTRLVMMKLAKPAMAFAFVFLIASGFIFQSKIKETTAGYFADKGHYYFNNGAYDTKKSERFFNLALRLNPNLDTAYYQLARIHLVEDDLDLARREIDKSLAINPENQRAFYIRGLIDSYDGKYADSIEDFKKFVAWAPREWAGYNDLAWAYALNKDFAGARDAAAAGLDEAGAENPWLLDNLGVAYLNLGEPQKAEEFFAKVKDITEDMTTEEWAGAYPGNNPSLAGLDLEKFKTDINSNHQLAAEGFTSGGVAVSACASAPPCNCSSSENAQHCVGSYRNSCGRTCTGTRGPDCSGAGNYCAVTNYNSPNGCGSCWGTIQPDCSGDANYCAGVAYGSPNGCGSCTGTKGPDCSGAANYCDGAVYNSPNGCGTCTGTKAPTYAPVCSHVGTGSACDQNTCGQSISTATAFCTNTPTNGCGSPSLIDLSNCSGCADTMTGCPTCSWKEVAP